VSINFCCCHNYIFVYGLWCSTPLSTIFQLYKMVQMYLFTSFCFANGTFFSYHCIIQRYFVSKTFLFEHILLYILLFCWKLSMVAICLIKCIANIILIIKWMWCLLSKWRLHQLYWRIKIYCLIDNNAHCYDIKQVFFLSPSHVKQHNLIWLVSSKLLVTWV
jgi:hypothetical protein